MQRVQTDIKSQLAYATTTQVGVIFVEIALGLPRLALVHLIGHALLRNLQPRLYSIASSPKAHPGEVHLCVGVVRYESLGRGRKGVCSTFLADRVPDQTPVPVYVHENRGFRPPADPDRPLIMVGPGTGIAPFRAFLEERRETGAKGTSWLFFGDQHASLDFLFRDARLVVEVDGAEFHAGFTDRLADRSRDDRLRKAGWAVMRFGWTDVVDRPGAVAAIVRSGVSSGRQSDANSRRNEAS